MIRTKPVPNAPAHSPGPALIGFTITILRSSIRTPPTPPAVASSPIANGSGNVAPTTLNVAEVTGTSLLNKLAPSGLKAGQRVVAFGLGQRNTAIGKTSTTTPLYPGADKTYYGRYVVYLMIYASGERATLLGVSDSYGRTPDFTQQRFNESLPDGARQG